MSNEREPLPLARTDALVIKELQDEVLVYDLKRHKAHCLNQASAIVWKHCDGQRSVAEMRRVLETELAASMDEDVVRLALNQLQKFHLLEQRNGKSGMMNVSRRDLVRKYLPAALVLPAILSIPAPTAAQAASNCAQACQSCEVIPCCAGFDCDGICFPCVTLKGTKTDARK